MPPLEEEPAIQIVGVATSGHEALALAGALQPDVITMDLNMPYLSGLAAMERLEERDRMPGVLILTGLDDPAQVWNAFAAGARGFLRKDAITDELLLSAIFTVGSGGIFLDSSTFELLRASFPASAESAGQTRQSLVRLSSQDKAILRYVALGRENHEIGQLLDLNPKTISNRLSRIYALIGIPNRVAAATFALRAGLLDLYETG